MESERCKEERALFEQQPVEFQAGFMTYALLDFGHAPVPQGKIETAQLLTEVTRALGEMGHLNLDDPAVRTMIIRGVAQELQLVK